MHVELDDLSSTSLCATFRSLFTRCLGCLKVRLVYSQTDFFRHEQCKIDRETIGVVQSPDILAIEFSLLLFKSFGGILVEELLASIKCSRK